MGAYFMMFAAMAIGLPLPIVNIIAAAVYLFMDQTKKSRYVRFHALHSLYAQIPVTLLNAGAVTWVLLVFFRDYALTNIFWGYIALVALANLTYFTFSIIAAVKARNGQFFYFLFFGKLAYHLAYRVKEDNKTMVVNQPPKM